MFSLFVSVLVPVAVNVLGVGVAVAQGVAVGFYSAMPF